MRTSRRHLIKIGMCATASLVTLFDGLSGRVALAAANVPPPEDSGGWLTREMFEARVGENVTVRRPRSTSLRLRLVRVEDVPSALAAGTVGHPECFTVLLRGSRSPRLVQGTYRVESTTLGTFLLFLVPGTTSGTSITYTATFNRVVAV